MSAVGTAAQPGRATGREEIGCIFCSESESRPVIEENGYTGRQCGGCGLIYISPRPSRREVEELYAADRAHLPADLFLSHDSSPAARLSARRNVRLLRGLAAGGRLLEIGPGSGNVLAEALRQGLRPYGVEANPAQAAFIRSRGIRCVERLDEVAELGEPAFDVVYHRDVLSHLYDPIEEFRRINRLLAAGGHHVFETGNAGDVDHRYFRYYRSFQYPDHLFFHSTASIRRLLEVSGFELVRIERYSLLPELWQSAQARRLAALVRGRSGGAEPGEGTPPRQLRRSALGTAARAGLDLSRYATTAGLGRLRRDAREPQTLVVVARKAAAAG